MSDANWFFSACAQTAGAIVAIVGGFLVSRLVSLDSERRGIGQSLKLSKGNLANALNRKREAEQELHDWDAEDYHSTVAWRIVDWHQNWMDAALIQLYQEDLLTENELRQIIQQIKTTATEATRFFSAMEIDDDSIASMEFEEAATGLTELARTTREVYRTVFGALRTAARSQINTRNPMLHPEWLLVTPATPADIGEQVAKRSVRNSLWQRVIEAKREVDRVESGIEALEREEAGRQRPKGLLVVWTTLAYLSVVGVAIPLALLPAGEKAPAWKTPVLVLFLIGLAFLLGYFLVSAASHRQKQK